MKKSSSNLRTNRLKTTRRQLLKGAAAASVALAAPAVWSAARADRKIIMRDPGGPFTKGFAEAYYEPFTKETGIQAIGVQGQHEPTGLIKAMVETGNFTWDGAILSKSSHQVLVNIDYLEPIAPKGGLGPNVSAIPENMRTEFISGNDVYATVMVHRTDTVEKPPTNWQEWFDKDNYPGIRSMHKHPFDTMEFALIADGVAPTPEALYPIDFDRAFKSLDKIKDEVAVWWTGGAQTSQLLQAGEVDLIYTWNGRAQVAIDAGAPAVINWNQAMWTFEGWSILKGTPNADLVREFIEFCAQPDRQAAYTPHVAYGPTNPGAYEYVDPERAKVLPTNPKYIAQMIETDTDYWGKNKDAASELFNAWLLG